MNQPKLLPAVEAALTEARKSVYIAANRLDTLQRIASAVTMYIEKHREVKLIFICTHNSRRSHMSQLWAEACAYRYGLSGIVFTYSGGTEATAFYPSAIRAMENSGWQRCEGNEVNSGTIPREFQNLAPSQISELTKSKTNPVVLLRYAFEALPAFCFSKRFDEDPNPTQDFMAVMTCSDADEQCPLVPGASARFSLPYADPKVHDKQADAQKFYDDRCREIAAEIDCIFRLVAKSQNQRAH